MGSHIRAILSFDHIIFNSPNNQPRHKNNNTPTDLLFVWCIFHFLLKGCVWIDFKLIPEIIYRKIGCLVVTSNSVKLKSISSWSKMRATTTENHFRFHFHFKWNATEKNIEEREKERERGRKKEEIATSLALRRPSTSLAPRRSREVSGFDDFFLGFVCVLRNEWYYIFVWQPRKCEQQVENVFSMVFSRTQPNIRKYFLKHFLKGN